MDFPLLARMAQGLRTALPDSKFYDDVQTRLMEALAGGLRDVLPTGAGPIVGRNLGVPVDPKYRDKLNDIGLAGLTVYHGSPHSFDKFDMSKIGTGEGAQAYGHGLYFAETPTVAKYYRSPLNMNTYGNAEPAILRNIARDVGDDPQAIFNEFSNRVKSGLGEKYGTAYKDAIQKIKSVDDVKQILASQPGNIYKVDLPDEHIAKMLDWDKPLSQQSWYRPVDDVVKEYQGAGKKADAYAKLISKANARGSEITGRQLYEGMLSQFGGSQAKVTEFMREAGIPGIRYLDQGSRAGGKGTSNFVVFDDALPRIIGKE